jgi:hypothetical protein
MKEDGAYDQLMDSFGITKIDTWDAWPGEFRSYFNGE